MKVDFWTLDLFRSFEADEKKDKRTVVSTDRRTRKTRSISDSERFDLDEIEVNSRLLMSSLGKELIGTSLLDLGWKFRFDRAKTRLGCCTWSESDRSDKALSISRHYSALQGWDFMEDVVRHEIAHAIDVETRRRTDHSATWKEWARKCGADPTRLYEGEAVKAFKPKYLGICPCCGAEYPYYRKPRRQVACSTCCKRFTRGRYSDQFRITFYETEEFEGHQMTMFTAG